MTDASEVTGLVVDHARHALEEALTTLSASPGVIRRLRRQLLGMYGPGFLGGTETGHGEVLRLRAAALELLIQRTGDELDRIAGLREALSGRLGVLGILGELHGSGVGSELSEEIAVLRRRIVEIVDGKRLAGVILAFAEIGQAVERCLQELDGGHSCATSSRQ